MSEDQRLKPKTHDVALAPMPDFEREAAILFQVPVAEVTAAEKARLKRPPPRRKSV